MSTTFSRSGHDDGHPRKTSKRADLPDDCLNHVYESLKSSTDRISFGLVCRRWLHIRFQRLKLVSLLGSRPNITTPQSQLSGLLVLLLCLNPCFKYSDINPPLLFSWFPRLALLRLIGTRIPDNGLKVLAICCASLERVDLTNSRGITDSGITFLLQNCRKLRSLTITDCSNVTGIGFLGCPKTLTYVEAEGVYNKLTARGIKAIASGGGLQSLYLSGNEVTNDAVITVSKSCTLLKVLQLKSCHEVQLEGWKAIGLYCSNLKALYVVDCPKLCHLGLQAWCHGCNKLSYLFVDSCKNFAIDLFQRERPNVHLLMNRDRET